MKRLVICVLLVLIVIVTAIVLILLIGKRFAQIESNVKPRIQSEVSSGIQSRVSAGIQSGIQSGIESQVSVRIQSGIPTNLGYQQIPRHIYQTNKSNRVPINMKQAIDSWIKLNPEYEYHYFNDYDCRTFIKNNFDAVVVQAYDSLIPGAFKADLWRYCVLYINGGVYIDTDMIALVPLNQLIDPSDTFVSCRDHDPNAIFNAFICTVPKHPILKEMINHVVYYTQNRLYGENSLEPTGPVGLGMVMKKLYHVYGSFSLQTRYFKLLDHPVGQEILYYNGEACIQNKYPEYDSDKQQLQQPSYYSLWAAKEMYKRAALF